MENQMGLFEIYLLNGLNHRLKACHIKEKDNPDNQSTLKGCNIFIQICLSLSGWWGRSRLTFSKGRCPFLRCESLSGLFAGSRWYKAFRSLKGIGTLVFSTNWHWELDIQNRILDNYFNDQFPFLIPAPDYFSPNSAAKTHTYPVYLLPIQVKFWWNWFTLSHWAFIKKE